ncbi:MAG: RnfABCDGE type electron transport complex subunit B [Oligosphaeraceae bacterium]
MSTLFIIVLVGLITGIAIAIVSRYFGVEANPLEEEVKALLPGANCGGCGYAGCGGYAKALVAGQARPGACAAQKAEDLQKMATLLGAEVDTKEPRVAVVMCSGDDLNSTRQAQYNGINNCRDAMIVAAGAKTCTFGCLGLGACARACPFGAIEMTPTHLAVVHKELCRGCGKCIQVCPKKLIRLVPKSAVIHVHCSSPLKGAVKLKACKAACIGCGKCVKAAPENMRIDTGVALAQINYGNPPSEELAAVCPTHALRK